MHQLSPAERAIKAATFQAIRKIGGVEAAAEYVRVNKSSLANYYSINHPDCFVPADVALVLDEQAGYPFITDAMAGALNLHCYKAKDPHDLLAAMLKEAGDLGCVVSKALADGSICAREAADITKEATDLKEACQRLIDMAVSGQGGV